MGSEMDHGCCSWEGVMMMDKAESQTSTQGSTQGR